MKDTDKVSSEEEFGLKDDWDSILKTLEEIIPVYDKTNRFISLGTDLRLRRKGIDLLIEEFGDSSFSLLDLGSGTGSMARLVFEKAGSRARITLVDPISKMMKVARKRADTDGLLAIYEFLPFRKGSIDATMAGFSLRDARDLSAALKEINQLLKINGKFLIVDLSKPDSKLKSEIISLYWRVIAPFIAFLSSGRLGLKFGALSKTFDRLPRFSEFLQIVKREGFEVSKSEFRMLGGANVTLLTKIE